MSKRNFMELIQAQWDDGKFACVGLDSLDVGRMKRVVDETKDLVCAYKPNIAFYEEGGGAAINVLRGLFEHIHEVAPEVPVILDAKRGDIGNTNHGYAQMAFFYLQADAITVHPYLGQESLEAFLQYEDKAIFVLTKTSNPGSSEFQDREVIIDRDEADYLGVHDSTCLGGITHTPLYKHVAYRVSQHWNQRGNCGLVVGATYPEELEAVRSIAGDLPILIPGIGRQGGNLEKSVEVGKNSQQQGMIFNSSRDVIESEDPKTVVMGYNGRIRASL